MKCRFMWLAMAAFNRLLPVAPSPYVHVAAVTLNCNEGVSAVVLNVEIKTLKL